MKISADKTPAKIGRWMKNCEKFMGSSLEIPNREKKASLASTREALNAGALRTAGGGGRRHGTLAVKRRHLALPPRLAIRGRRGRDPFATRRRRDRAYPPMRAARSAATRSASAPRSPRPACPGERVAGRSQ